MSSTFDDPKEEYEKGRRVEQEILAETKRTVDELAEIRVQVEEIGELREHLEASRRSLFSLDAEARACSSNLGGLLLLSCAQVVLLALILWRIW